MSVVQDIDWSYYNIAAFISCSLVHLKYNIPNAVSSCELQTKNQMSNPSQIWYQNEARNKTSSIQVTIFCSVLTDRRPTTLKTSFDTNRYFVLSSRNQCSANMAELALKQLNFSRHVMFNFDNLYLLQFLNER